MMKTTATLLGFTAILFWSTSSAGCRALVETLGPCTYVAITSGAAGVLLLLASALRSRSLFAPFRISKPSLALLGPLFVGYFALYSISFSLSPRREMVLSLGLVNYLWPPLTVLFSIPLLGRRARLLLVIPGMALAVFGAALSMLRLEDISAFFSDLTEAPLAFALMLIAAVCFGLYSNLTVKYPEPTPLGATAVFQLATGLIMLIFRFVVQETSTWNAESVGLLIYMTLLPTMAGYLLWDIGMRKGNSLQLGVMSYLLPITSTLVASWYLDVELTAKVAIGSVLVVVAALVCKIGMKSPIDVN